MISAVYGVMFPDDAAIEAFVRISPMPTAHWMLQE